MRGGAGSALLYGINTLGAVTGAMLATFVALGILRKPPHPMAGLRL
jgi:hypothetical protein